MVHKLTQAELDAKIRSAAAPHAVEEKVGETAKTQTYVLSNGAILRIWKADGHCQIGCTRP